MTNCPNCNTKLIGMLTEVKMYDKHRMKFIKDFTYYKGNDLCGKCGGEHLQSARQKYIALNSNMEQFLNDYKHSFPIVTISNPVKWEYDTLGIVTAQASMENQSEQSGIKTFIGSVQNIVDLDSSVNNGEKICFEILRQKAFLLGGNTILGVDIDYQQTGSKGENILICMAGTAVKLNNLEDLSRDFADKKTEYETLEDKINKLKEHSKIAHSKE